MNCVTTRTCNFAHPETLLRKSRVKKWLQIFPALKVNRPSRLRFCAVSAEISEYSTTWYRPRTLHTTPTASVGEAFSTTCTYIENRYDIGIVERKCQAYIFVFSGLVRFNYLSSLRLSTLIIITNFMILFISFSCRLHSFYHFSDSGRRNYNFHIAPCVIFCSPSRRSRHLCWYRTR